MTPNRSHVRIFYVVALLALEFTSFCPGLKGQQPRQVAQREDLVRWSIKRAERCLERMDNDLGDYTDRWRDLAGILPLISEREVAARANLLLLKCVQRSLSNWPRWGMLPEYRDWLQNLGSRIYFVRSESVGWYVRSEEFWRLHDEFNGLAVSDDIAWEAAKNPVPDFCETDMACYFHAVSDSAVRYLETHPAGKYVPLALTALGSFFDRFEQNDFFKVRLEEILWELGREQPGFNKDEAQEIMGYLRDLRLCLKKVVDLNADKRAREAGQAFERIFGRYLDGRFPSERPSRSSLDAWGTPPGDDLRDGVKSTFSQFFHEYDLEFEDITSRMKALEAAIPLLGDRESAALAKFAKLLGLKRALRFGDEGGCRPREFDKWAAEQADLIGIRRVRPAAYWQLFEEYRDLPIADDIAWEACNDFEKQPESDGPVGRTDFERQLDELMSSMGTYLLMEPDGKYVSIALHRIAGFFRICMNEDPLTPPPHGAELASRADLAAARSTLSSIALKIKSEWARGALVALERFEKRRQGSEDEDSRRRSGLAGRGR